MTEQEVVTLMKSSKSEKEWNANCDEVKRKCGGYPSFWWSAIVQSGVARDVAFSWSGSAEVKVTSL